MIGFLLLAGLALGAEAAVNCDKLGTLLYEDMNCKPIYDGKTGCPSMFSCKGLKKSSKNCFYKDSLIKLNETLDSQQTAINCDLACKCQKKSNKMKFNCATIDCPEWLRVAPKPGCYRKYSLDSCCSIREVCPPYDNTTQCIYDGKVYKEGDNFLPRGSCWRCVCQEGWKGKVEEPFCRRISCNVQVKHQDKIQERCAPLYFNRAYRDDNIFCCPANKWICADGTEIIEGKPTSEKYCIFGDKKLRIGQGFVKNVPDIMIAQKVECECKLPPLLTCTAEII